MSKADGWEKQKNGYEWRKSGPTFRAEICRITGGYYPYQSDVYPLPRSEHLDESGRYKPIFRGSGCKLAEVKAMTDEAINNWLDSKK